MVERRLPPLPEVSLDSYKKSKTPQIDAYLLALRGFAEDTGFWQTLNNQLQHESFFVDLRHQHQSPSSHADTSAQTAAQGLVITGYEEGYKADLAVTNLAETNPQLITASLEAWLYHHGFFHHPEFLDTLQENSNRPFKPLRKKRSVIMRRAHQRKQTLSIHDLTLTVGAANQERVSRTKVLAHGLQVTYPQGQPRNILVVGENPDVTGSPLMLATLASAHHLIGLPRDGFFKDTERQIALGQETFELIKEMSKVVGRSSKEQTYLTELAMKNVVGVIESEPEAALSRAQALYESGIRTFRIYSPEPNSQLVATILALRKYAQNKHWQPIEIFAGQVVSVPQAIEAEKAGADAIYLGVGGGGRCITGVVANLAIDWPILLWELRGKLKIPVIVQGGANDNPITSIALGASGIGVVGKLAGSLESPGGTLYFTQPSSPQPFVYYGGEASNRMRAIAGRFDPLGRTINTEGEATQKYLVSKPDQGIFPIAMQRMMELQEHLATGLVFQNVRTIAEAQEKAPGSLQQESAWMHFSRNTH